MVDSKKPKIIVILGTTASGKSAVAVRLAKKIKGEIISADSRQVYKGLNIGSGKITKTEMKGITHHLLDVTNAKKQFTVSKYKMLGDKAIAEIISRGNTPIICGGTGFYVSALVDGIILPEVPPNKTLRKNLAKKSVSKLFSILLKIDPARARDIDQNNARRMIRAIEIAKTIGKVPAVSINKKYEPFIIGLTLPKRILRKRIHERLLHRLQHGMISETKRLHNKGLSWKRMDELGLEYRFLSQYLQNKMTKEEMTERLKTAIWQFSKRQITWFKRDRRIKWYTFKHWKTISEDALKFLKYSPLGQSPE